MTKVVQILPERRSTAGTEQCPVNDAELFGVYMGATGDFAWLADFNSHTDARNWAEEVAENMQLELDDVAQRELNEEAKEGRETNSEFLDRVMNLGCPTGPLIQAFVITALQKYSDSVARTPAGAFDSPMLSGEAWKATGLWLKAELDKKYGAAA